MIPVNRIAAFAVLTAVLWLSGCTPAVARSNADARACREFGHLSAPLSSLLSTIDVDPALAGSHVQAYLAAAGSLTLEASGAADTAIVPLRADMAAAAASLRALARKPGGVAVSDVLAAVQAVQEDCSAPG
jgi:hypothetical protein